MLSQGGCYSCLECCPALSRKSEPVLSNCFIVAVLYDTVCSARKPSVRESMCDPSVAAQPYE